LSAPIPTKIGSFLKMNLSWIVGGFVQATKPLEIVKSRKFVQT